MILYFKVRKKIAHFCYKYICKKAHIIESTGPQNT